MGGARRRAARDARAQARARRSSAAGRWRSSRSCRCGARRARCSSRCGPPERRSPTPAIRPRGARLGVAFGTTLGGIGGWLRAVRATTDSATARRAGVAGATPVRRRRSRRPRRRAAQSMVPSVACASGNAALGAALDLVRRGRCDVVLAGGVDALHDFVIAGFGALKALDPEPCRPFDRARRGLNLGEGAGFLVVESEAHARARGARIRAFLDGYGVSADAVHMTGPDREGRGAARAMLAALADAGRTRRRVDYVSAHGTATPFNDLMEAKALALVLGARAATDPVNSIKSAIGHTLGAAGALEALALRAHARDRPRRAHRRPRGARPRDRARRGARSAARDPRARARSPPRRASAAPTPRCVLRSSASG